MLKHCGLFSRAVIYLFGSTDLGRSRSYVSAILIDSIGDGIVLPVILLYLLQVAHFSLPTAGFVLMLSGIMGLLIVPVAGSVVAKFGAERTWCCTLTISTLTFGILTFIGQMGFKAEVIQVLTAFLIIFWTASERVAKVARQIIITSLGTVESRAERLSSQRALGNAGFGIGAVINLAVFLLVTSNPVLVMFAANAVLCLCAIYFVLMLDSSSRQDAPNLTKAEGSAKFWSAFKDSRYLLSTALVGAIYLHDSLLLVAIPAIVATRMDAPDYLLGVSFALNTILATVFQTRIAKGKTKLSDAISLFRLAVPLVLTFGIVMAFSTNITGLSFAALLVIAVILLTFVEMITAAAEFIISIEWADQRQLATYLSVFGAGADIQHILGPMLVTFLLSEMGATTWIIVTTLIATSCVLAAQLVRRNGGARD